MPRSFLLSSVAALLFTASAPAQSSLFDDVNPGSVPWPGTPSTDVVVDADSCQTLADGRIHAVFLDQHGAWWLVNHGTYWESFSYPGTFHDMDLLRTSGAGTPDAMVFVGASRLERVTFDGSSFTTLTLGGAIWDDAQSVMVADFDGNGTKGVGGVSADGLQFLIVHDAASGGSQTATFPLFGPPLAVEVADLTGDTAAEIVAVYPFGLTIYSDTGAILQITYATITSAHLVELPQAGTTPSLMAVVHSDGTDQWLNVTGLGFTENAVPLGAEANGKITFLSEGRINGDATGVPDEHHDLVLGYEGNDSIRILLNQHSVDPLGPSFVAVGGDDWADLGASATGNSTPVLIKDFDNDGDEDVMAYWEADQEFRFLANELADPSDQVPSVTESGGLRDLELIPGVGTNPPQMDFDFNWYLPVATMDLSPVTNLEIIIRRHDDPTPFWEGDEVVYWNFVLSDPVANPSGSLDLDSYEVPALAEGSISYDTHLSVQMRMFETDPGTGAVVRSWPAMVAEMQIWVPLGGGPTGGYDQDFRIFFPNVFEASVGGGGEVGDDGPGREDSGLLELPQPIGQTWGDDP